ncbi:MAG: helix-turn-helix domain-containing protein [Gemmatimonadales bacterium]|nr:helix-turn-helix domain-containing protein [Gemmatimonadales bacterium]
METVIDGIGAPLGATEARVGLSVAEVATALGVSERLVRTVVANGDLPVKKVGRRWVISRDGLVRWMDAGGAVAGQRRAR